MPSASTGVSFEVLGHDECIELLGREEICRLAWVVDGGPRILPLNYAWDGEAAVVRSDPGTKLNELENSDVALEVDRIDRVRREGWSVVIHGTAHEVSPEAWPSTAIRPSDLYLEPWVPGGKGHWVRVVPHAITGRRIRRHNEVDVALWVLPGDAFSTGTAFGG
jgi:nitroimidazol reductase NimA-like FMN-containing flavoprotein (pyridoxamine 5'-phosphate oxidase superfamily)